MVTTGHYQLNGDQGRQNPNTTLQATPTKRPKRARRCTRVIPDCLQFIDGATTARPKGSPKTNGPQSAGHPHPSSIPQLLSGRPAYEDVRNLLRGNLLQWAVECKRGRCRE